MRCHLPNYDKLHLRSVTENTEDMEFCKTHPVVDIYRDLSPALQDRNWQPEILRGRRRISTRFSPYDVRSCSRANIRTTAQRFILGDVQVIYVDTVASRPSAGANGGRNPE